MNVCVFQIIANKLKNCILNGDKSLWSQLILISDDIAVQSLNKWFEDYFVIHQATTCEIILKDGNDHTASTFRCFIQAEYKNYDSFKRDYLIKIDPVVLKIVSIQEVYQPSDRNNICWYVTPPKNHAWWKSSLAKEKMVQDSNDLSHKLLARAITRNIRFREAHMELECASLLTCIMSAVIFHVYHQLSLPSDQTEEKIKILYNTVRDRFCLRMTRPDRDNTWASKYLVPWYGIEEILTGGKKHKRIPISCNAFMTILYALLRWSGFRGNQLVQFRIANQDYLIIQNDAQKLYFISHDTFSVCSKKTIYPSGKISKAFGAEWVIDFNNNSAVASPEQIQAYNQIAEMTFLPKYNLIVEEKDMFQIDTTLPVLSFPSRILHMRVFDSISLWAAYAHQTLFVSKPEAYVYWSVHSNWGDVSFENEKEIYDYIKQMKRRSIFCESDRIMTADQCIRHQTGSTKDIAVFLYAALKKFLDVQGCVVFTDKYEYCIYRYNSSDVWVIYNVCCQKVEKAVEGKVLLACNEIRSFYPLIDEKGCNQTWFYEMLETK